MTFVCVTNCEKLEEQVCKLPESRARVWVQPTSWPMPISDVHQAFGQAVRIWTSVARLELEPVEGYTDADILVRPCSIDGQGKVLAWSEMPCPYRPPIAQCYDVREDWDPRLDAPRGKISLAVVMAHEIGHALGLPHGPQGNIMAPTYDGMVTRPGPWDIEQIQLRYGAATPPTPPEGPKMSKWLECLIQVMPQYLACVFKAQAEAAARGERGPIDELLAVLTNQSVTPAEASTECPVCTQDSDTESSTPSSG
jgi:hypothetical protein